MIEIDGKLINPAGSVCVSKPDKHVWINHCFGSAGA
jgi:hypothetical protein